MLDTSHLKDTNSAAFDLWDGSSIVAFRSADLWRVHVTDTDLNTLEEYKAKDWREAGAIVQDLHARLQAEM